MRKVIKSSLFIFLFCFLLLSSCSKNDENDSSKDTEDLSTDTTAEGIIKEIYSADNDITGLFIAEGEVDEEDAINKYSTAYVNITDKTKVYDLKANEILPEDLQEGMYVQIVFYGSIAESYPPQGNAYTIHIIKDK